MNIGDFVGRQRDELCGCTPDRDMVPKPDPCGLPDGHPGQHADISYSGMVLRLWGDPNREPGAAGGGIPEHVHEVMEQIGQIAEDLRNALNRADFELRDIAQHNKDDDLIQELCFKTRLPDEYDVEVPFDWDDEAKWDESIDEIRNSKSMLRRIQAKKRAS